GLGVDAPYSRELLKRAARVYLKPRELVNLATDWFESALRYLSDAGEVGISLLEPVADGQLQGQVSGYQLQDYIMQYGQRRRHLEIIPAGLWKLLGEMPDTPKNLRRLGRLAELRGLLDYAELFYIRSFNESGNYKYLRRLALLLDRQDRTRDLLVLALFLSETAMTLLTRKLREEGSIRELKLLANKTAHVQAVG